MNDIEICNIALGRIGAEAIERMDEASAAARICRRYYDFTRQSVLRKFPWTFAVRRVYLALLAEKPPDYKYAYRYPADALCVRKLYDRQMLGNAEDNQYRILADTEGRKIYTDVAEAWIEYTADVKDESLFDSQFIDALAWKLAAEIAVALSGNVSIMQNCIQAYNAYFAEAAGEDADEENVFDPVADRLALGRWEGL